VRGNAEAEPARTEPVAPGAFEIADSIPNIDHRHGDGRAEIIGIAVLDEHGRRVDMLEPCASICVRVSARASSKADEITVHLVLEDTGTAPALAAKLTLVDQSGQRILPAFYSDNYLSLLPGEPRQIEIRYPGAHAGTARVNLRGWNVEPLSTPIEITR